MNLQLASAAMQAVQQTEIRIRGRVQGVGFRPTVWRIARELALPGEVLNDGEGVTIRTCGTADAIDLLIARLLREPPPLAVIDRVETSPHSGPLPADFTIARSRRSAVHTEVPPDAAACPECIAEVMGPSSRRYRYPFATCTHCGPRLTIVRDIPYDRAATTMAPFGLCPDCQAEYDDPADRRFHAETTACHVCGPKARLVRLDGRPVGIDQHATLDAVDAAMSLVQAGEIVAVKALGGYQLACDASNGEAVERLRILKQRHAKPFALMARDLAVIRSFAQVSEAEERALTSTAAPIVLLDAKDDPRLPDAVAPGLATLGFMLPSTPLHHLMLHRMSRPVVMTSGNISDEPQIIDDAEAAKRLAGIASFALVHDRGIANRVDDSVVRVMAGVPRVFRRSRGYAPSSMALPAGFERAPDLLAFGGELKATFCLVKDGRAVLSQHQGDLDQVRVYEDYCRNLGLYRDLHAHRPQVLAADLHPSYLSARLAKEMAREAALPLVGIQHHHAHAASCLADNGRPLDAPPVLAVVLDGSGFGGDATIWGGEFLLADYVTYDRLAAFKPVRLPGGEQAARQPWRNLYAHLMAAMGWEAFSRNFAGLGVFAQLDAKPRATLDAMAKAAINSPLASSCGRLFDAVAAALGICFDRQNHEGDAAARLESMVCAKTLSQESDEFAYPFAIANLPEAGIPYVEPLAMWNAILGDLSLGTPPGVIAARFHKGLARAIATMAVKLARRGGGNGSCFDTVALSGGCFHNRTLFEACHARLEAAGLAVLAHAHVPANDGGLALGQAAIAAAQLIRTGHARQQGS